MSGPHENAGDRADAHSADAGEAASPDVAGRALSGLRYLVEAQLRHARPRRALAPDGDVLEAAARADPLARAVVDAPGHVGVHLPAVVGLYVLQARTARQFRAGQAEPADLLVDVRMLPARKVAQVAADLALDSALAAHPGDRALLVRDDHLHPVGEEGLLQQAPVLVALLRIHADD